MALPPMATIRDGKKGWLIGCKEKSSFFSFVFEFSAAVRAAGVWGGKRDANPDFASQKKKHVIFLFIFSVRSLLLVTHAILIMYES